MALRVAARTALVGGADGLPLPRPGCVRIVVEGCWEAPQAFFVRFRGRALLFRRAFADLTDEYCVVALPSDSDGQALRFASFVPPEDSRLLGVVPARDLQFEHRGGDFVRAASLSAVLRHLAAS